VLPPKLEHSKLSCKSSRTNSVADTECLLVGKKRVREFYERDFSGIKRLESGNIDYTDLMGQCISQNCSDDKIAKHFKVVKRRDSAEMRTSSHDAESSEE